MKNIVEFLNDTLYDTHILLEAKGEIPTNEIEIVQSLFDELSKPNYKLRFSGHTKNNTDPVNYYFTKVNDKTLLKQIFNKVSTTDKFYRLTLMNMSSDFEEFPQYKQGDVVYKENNTGKYYYIKCSLKAKKIDCELITLDKNFGYINYGDGTEKSPSYNFSIDLNKNQTGNSDSVTTELVRKSIKDYLNMDNILSSVVRYPNFKELYDSFTKLKEEGEANFVLARVFNTLVNGMSDRFRLSQPKEIGFSKIQLYNPTKDTVYDFSDIKVYQWETIEKKITDNNLYLRLKVELSNENFKSYNLLKGGVRFGFIITIDWKMKNNGTTNLKTAFHLDFFSTSITNPTKAFERINSWSKEDKQALQNEINTLIKKINIQEPRFKTLIDNFDLVITAKYEK